MVWIQSALLYFCVCSVSNTASCRQSWATDDDDGSHMCVSVIHVGNLNEVPGSGHLADPALAVWGIEELNQTNRNSWHLEFKLLNIFFKGSNWSMKIALPNMIEEFSAADLFFFSECWISLGLDFFESVIELIINYMHQWHHFMSLKLCIVFQAFIYLNLNDLSIFSSYLRFYFRH